MAMPRDDSTSIVAGKPTQDSFQERPNILPVALSAQRSGICVLPPLENGTKQPLSDESGSWKRWQQVRSTIEDIQHWYSSKRTGIGFVCGRVSGGLELFEFDDFPTYKSFVGLAKASGLGYLVERIEAGYLEETPSIGIHWFYRCTEISGNTKLARRPKRPEEKDHQNDNVKVLIETRGEGGYAIVAPSFGKVHPTGQAYRLIHGSAETIATITSDERRALWQLAKTFDQIPKLPVKEELDDATNLSLDRPGDDYNFRGDWNALLERHDWFLVHQRGETSYWRRPGKDRGISATTNYKNSNLLYVFSTSTVFDAERGYSKFSAYALLEHEGNYQSAAKALAEQGYGLRSRNFRTSEAYTLGGSEEDRQIKIISSMDVPPPVDGADEGLLGPFIPRPPAVILLSGESSAGKTVLSYNLAHHIAEGLDFANLPAFGPLRVLYCDLENPENVHRNLVHTIGGSENLAFIRELAISLHSDAGRAIFTKVCKNFEPDILFLDPLSIAWPVADENDNSMADRQMWELKRIAIDLNCVVVALWNMGEGNVKDKFKARGATARIDRADLALNYSELTENSRRLKIVKSRYGTLGQTITLRFSADMGFDAIESDEVPSASKINSLQTRIREQRHRIRITRQELVQQLGNEDLVDKAVSRMRQAGELNRIERGVYAFVTTSEPPN